MVKGLLAVALAGNRIAAQLRAIGRHLARMADVMERQAEGGSRGGVSLRTFYGDTRDGAVDDADLLTQTDAEFAALERLERERVAAGGAVGLEDDLEEAGRGY